MDNYSFGYPKECDKCVGLTNSQTELRVEPHYKEGNNLRLMLIGQDPTIFRKPERVKQVLMLDEVNSQLSRWLKELFGRENYQNITIYATNLVKCSFDKPPSTTLEGGLKFLTPFFRYCQNYLAQEIQSYIPDCVLALGEPAHKLFITILHNQTDIPETMQEAFTGDFIKARIGGCSFDYSPCLHIKTWRVAEVYGESVNRFKSGISTYFRNEPNI